MADQKYSALALVVPKPGDIFAVDQLGTSQSVTVSSVAATNTSSQGMLFNNQGQISTDVTSLQYHFSTQVMHLSGSSSQIWLQTQKVQPASTGASTVALYASAILGGYVRPAMMSYQGLERPLQMSLYDDTIALWSPTTSAPGRIIGGDSVTIGAFTATSGSVGSAYLTKKRSLYKTASNSANGVAGLLFDRNELFQGSTSGYGGYFFFCRFGFETFATSTRYLVGVTAQASSAIVTSNTGPINTVGFRFIDSVTSWGFYHSSTGVGTTETIPNQTSFASGNAYDAYIYAPPNTTVIYYRLDDLNANSTMINSSVTNHLPNSTSMGKAVALVGALNTSANAGSIGVVKMYTGSDI